MPFSLLAGMVGAGGSAAAGNTAAAAGQATQSYLDNAALADRRASSAYTSAGYAATNKLLSLDGLGHLNPMSTGQGSYGDTSLNTSDVAGDQTNAFNDFRTTPGYQFRLDQGLRAVDQSAAARGLSLSGGNIKGESDYAQGTASAEYGNYVNQLQNLSGQGSASTNATSAAASSLQGQAGNALMQGGLSAAGYQQASGNALASGINKTGQDIASLVSFNPYKAFGNV